MSGHSSAHPHHHEHSVGFNLGAIMVIIAILGVGLAYWIDSAGRMARGVQHRDDDGLTLTRTLGGHELEIPRGWFRYDEQRVEGFAKQIDLRLDLPLGAAGTPITVEVTLLPRSRARPSAALLDGVYLHKFLPEQLAGVSGLVGKPLQADDGFENETVWYDPLSAEPFVAKCSKPSPASVTAQCLRTVYLGPGVAAVYAFDEAVLQNWRQFDVEMTARLEQIGAL